ncbi:ead/Ea22-like family protein [Escherichia coli]|nr:ead/Ea22-like family protein [Escherichia coli]EGB0958931.1 ead/Ea22-like family protein [Escherichia coli]HCJ9377009.1 ead/Ea22-like family protein [Escherichia coli]
MSKIDYQKLREIAEKTKIAGEAPVMPFDQRINALNDFMKHFSPDIALALLDERERNQQYIKRRDQENEDIALTVGKLLIENGRLVADTLRHLADNEIDSDYFAITSTNENGTEIDHEMAITDYALQAAGTVDELVAALEAAEKRIAELEAREISLPERSSMLHRTDFHDDYQTVMAYKVSEVIAAIRAAGIRIKGE